MNAGDLVREYEKALIVCEEMLALERSDPKGSAEKALKGYGKAFKIHSQASRRPSRGRRSRGDVRGREQRNAAKGGRSARGLSRPQ